MKIARWIISSTLVLMWGCATTSFVFAQNPQQSEDVIKVNTELVQTDFTVFDKQGNFVDRLKREQFTLKVEGKARDIAFFDRVAAGSRSEEAQLAAARGAPGREIAVPLDRGRIVLFFLDDLHLSLSSLSRTRDLLKRFIDSEMGQNDLVEIVSTSGQLGFLQQLTDNKTVLSIAADRLRYQQITPGGLADHPPMGEYHAFLIEQGDTQIFDYFVEAVMEQMRIPRALAEQQVKGRAAALLKEASSISTRSMSTFETWMKQTAAIPGRKLVYFISDGFLLDERNSDNYDRLRRITSAAARLGVVIYSIDGRGLETTVQDAATAGNPDPFGRLSRAAMGEMRATQDVLNALAADTGGRAFFNNNDLSKAITTGLKETSTYYLLAWRPDKDEQRSPKYRQIQVTVVGHPDWTVRIRRASGPVEVEPSASFNEQATPDANVAAEKINTLLRAPYPASSLPVAITLNFFDTPETGLSLTTSIDVPMASLVFEPLNGVMTGVMDIGGGIFNDEGKSVTTFNKRFTIRGPADPPIAKPPGHVLYNHLASLKPGLYQVRVAAIDAKRGTVGGAHAWIEIPDLQSKKLTMSTLIVSEKTDGVTDNSIAANFDNPTTASPLANIALSVSHVFARSSDLRFFTFIYNATAAPGTDAAATPSPDLAITVQVFRDNEPVITTPLHSIATEGMKDLQRIPYGADVPLSNLSPGAYLLHVTVIDRRAKSSATQGFRFQIE